MTDAPFESIVRNIRTRRGLATELQFQAALAKEGITLDDLRRELEGQLIVSRVRFSHEQSGTPDSYRDTLRSQAVIIWRNNNLDRVYQEGLAERAK